MKSAILPLLAAVALGGEPPAPANAAASAVRTPQLDLIEMETRSFWHALSAAGTDFVSSWQIASDGSGSVRSIEWRRVGDIFQRSDVTRGFSAGRSGFRRIEQLLRPAEAFAATELPCGGIAHSDSAHGTVSWTRAGLLRRMEYDQGCPGAEIRGIFKRMDEAEALMKSWAARGRVLRSERLPDKP